ncbi:hypothetical protein UAW_01645 [Enterococcus haemoperoxidus ATCC BAA-382]|uniref:Uncharacterized protein n=1 Tax=Enterococcus haemoperoxidus ATCC BAA-382 TaxID=1158608 RepID=R2QPI0_9ENTE|nr:DUF916 and DUF3324 domain-containing protein [Enterococcus haemoperoxidus]EOH97163.1 hypothetical protein UAW_01645 [Enterococcus haemoperoxidus ATCC BAA-382]EOT59976.1 hypothetical protein I583_02611 [Enterococcus haemoperoxidus ATCC BAA-382]OJG56158.1 hypothetical protein RV06_GL000274 [Enterococcus haemoperoxidus]
MKRQKNKWLVYLSFFLVGITITFSQTGYANEKKDESGAAGFVYELQFPENQQQEVGYFDLKMQPGQQQTVQILVKNYSDEDIAVNVKLNGAKTNMNGVLEYGPTALENDASLKYDFTDLVKAPESIEVPKESEKMLDFMITMPESSYDGVIVGGIQLQKQDDANKPKQEGTAIINKYAYVVAMVLQESDVKVQPELELNKVVAGQSNYRNAVFIDASNTKANFLNDLTLEAQIMPLKSDEVLYETKKKSMRMAPNSNIKFPVSMGGEKMVPGKYRAHVLATSGKKKWEWTKEFSISNEEADKFNEEDLGLVQARGINWKLVAMVIASVMSVLIVIFIGIRIVNKRRAKKKKELSMIKKRKKRTE